MPENSGAMTTEDAALYLSVQPSTLLKWRVEGRGPSYVKMGRSVRYRPRDLEQWMGENIQAASRTKSLPRTRRSVPGTSKSRG